MKSEILNRFGIKIKNLRQEKSLTQEELANLCGLHKNYIGMIERGERNPSLININVLAEAFGISLSELMKF